MVTGVGIVANAGIGGASTAQVSDGAGDGDHRVGGAVVGAGAGIYYAIVVLFAVVFLLVCTPDRGIATSCCMVLILVFTD